MAQSTTKLLTAILHPQMSVIRFVLIYTLFSMLAYSGPVIDYSIRFLPDKEGVEQLLYVGSMLAAVAFLHLFTMFALAAISRRLLKTVAVLFLLTNSAAFYFITQYNVIIDGAIVLSVIATDQKTTTDLLHPKLALFVSIYGLIPAFFVLRTRLHKARWRSVAALLITLLSYGGFTGATFHTWLWLDKHMGTLGGVTLPWSYVLNSVLLWRESRIANAEKVPLPDAQFTREADRKQVVVLIIGESARAANHAQYGYPRETNPFTKDLGLATIPNVEACSTYTIPSLACMLHPTGNATPLFAPSESLPSYLSRHGIYSIWRSKGIGKEGHLNIEEYQTWSEIHENCTSDCPSPLYDTIMLYDLANRIEAANSDRVFIVLHQHNGSHGPSYFAQYPPEYEYFSPVCDTVLISDCDRDHLVNAYDNTVLYTDYMMAQAIRQLESLENAYTMMMYVSDHGESLGENGVYLHGTPLVVAPSTQFEVPAFVWLSESMKARHGFDPAQIPDDKTFGLGIIFHTVMGAFDLQSPIYQADQDILALP